MLSTHGIERFIDVFERDVKSAIALETPNPEDDITIRTAIVGFSYRSATTNWGRNCYQFLRSRIDNEYNDDHLTVFGNNGINVRLYYSLCIGYLLGLYNNNEIGDDEFENLEKQIPGLIMYHLPKILAVEVRG